MSLSNVDMLRLIGATMVLFPVMFTGGRRRLDRWEGLALLGAYAGYTAYLLYLRGETETVGLPPPVPAYRKPYAG